MRKSTLNAIISLSLVIFLLIPNISTAAVEISKVLQPLIEEEVQNEVKDTSDSSEGVEVTTQDDQKESVDDEKNQAEGEAEVKPEEEIDVAKDAVKDKLMDESKNTVKNMKQKSGEIYEVTQKPQTFSLDSSDLTDNELEREDVKGKLKANSEVEYLVPKTDSNYEIAIAKADGTYIYLDSANTIEEAKAQIENLPMAASENNDLPSIINNDGQVVYSTNSMYKMPATSGNIDLYTDGSLTKAFTYVNSGYVEDAPIIEENSIAYKIEVSGFTGWISKSVASEVVPMNQVTNPSYYIAQGGVLKHFISYDLKSTINKGYTLTLGPAPSYLREGVKYFSYDGNYFYDGSDFTTGLNNIISDLRNGNHSKSINESKPHYLYFNYLPFRSKSNYSATELNNFINANTEPTSKLRGIGQALVDSQNTYGVNAVLTLSVAINESAWGMSSIAQSKNNLFGIKAFDTNPGESADTFKTPGDSVLEFTKNYISRGYADPADWRYQGGFLGNKNKGTNVKYASDPFWGEKAAQFAHKIDFYLSSSNLSNLRDQDAYSLGIFKANNQVKNSSGALLYNVTNDQNQYAGYQDTSLILKNPEVIYKNGEYCYEIYPERNTPVKGGGPDNKYHGNYNWNDSGYVNTNGIIFTNSVVNGGTNGLQYQSHIQDKGWQNWRSEGEISGTSGEAKKIEAVRIKINNLIPGAGIQYRSHVQDYGWQNWMSDGELSGTSGQSKGVEAINIKLSNAPGYSVQYRVHVQDYGWQEWKTNGETAGTVGASKSIEAIEISVVKDGTNAKLNYNTHVQDSGWQDWKTSGETAGTVGSSKRLEGIQIKLVGAPAGAKLLYQVHVQDYGWQDWKSDGQFAGTQGKSKRLEAIKIKIENAQGYRVEYRTHIQDIGWQEWKSDGQMAGTEGQSKRLEAIEIRLVK